MKNCVKFLSVLMCILLSSPLCAAAKKAAQTENSVLNISQISEEQAQLCTAVMLDGFEAEETERSVSKGTLSSLSVSALEGEKCLHLTGNDKAGLTLKLTKRRTTANTRSLCVCVYVEPAEGAEFDMTVTLNGAEKTVTGTSSLPSGAWYAAYLQIDTGTTVTIESINININAKSTSSVRISALIDRVHTATVDGLPDKLRYFASDFTPNRAEIEYTDDALIFRPTGSNSYIESTPCGYMTNGRYNALAVRIENNCDAENVILRLKLDRQYSYTEENSHTLELLPGERVYSFPIGGFRSGVSVGAFRLELPGTVSGQIAIKGISFSSYRFPAEYAGTVKAKISDGKLTVYGTLPDYPASSKRVCLYRLTPGFDEEEPGAVDAEPYAEAPASSSFSFDLPLTENGYNNAYFKYLVRYETKTGYEDAGVAYAGLSYLTKPSVSFKGVSAPDDATLLSYLMPDAVYVDVDLGGLFAEEGEAAFKYAGHTVYVSAPALEKYDAIIERCAKEKLFSVIRLIYSPFADSEKYCFIAGNEYLPDLTSSDGAAHFMSLLSFFGERYRGKISAVIPCGALNEKAISDMRGITADKAEKYASDVIFSAQSALSPYGVPVIAPVTADGAELFLGMLQKDISEPDKLPVYIETDQSGAAELLESVSGCPFSMILSCRISSASELAHLYYGCRDAAGICVSGISAVDDLAELFSVIDTSYGVTAADRLAADGFPDGVIAVYPNITKAGKLYEDRGTLPSGELPQPVTTVYDGVSVDNWQNFDCCKSIYQVPVNGEDAAGLAFDFTSGCFGYAAFYPDTRKDYGTVYFRLYADYLPEDMSALKVRISAENDKGVTAGYCLLEPENVVVVPLQLESAGRIKRFTLAPFGMQNGETPRICVLGIYTSEKDSSDTVTEAQTETMPEPETQIFDTAEVTQADGEKGNGARLYIIAIIVILCMFALCGGAILILKKRDLDKRDKPS